MENFNSITSLWWNIYPCDNNCTLQNSIPRTMGNEIVNILNSKIRFTRFWVINLSFCRMWICEYRWFFSPADEKYLCINFQSQTTYLNINVIKWGQPSTEIYIFLYILRVYSPIYELLTRIIAFEVNSKCKD